MALFYQVKSVETLYEQMKQYMIGAGSTLNNFNDGSRLKILLMATAQLLHKCQYDYLQGIRSSIPGAVYDGFEFERLAGSNASGTFAFGRNSVVAPQDIPIPIGSSLIYEGLVYETIEVGQIDSGNLVSGDIASRAKEPGLAANISSSGTIDTRIGSGSFQIQPVDTDYAVSTSPFAGGSDTETDQARLERFRIYINGLVRTTPTGIHGGALSVSGVLAATVVSNFPTPGYVTVFADDGSGNLSAEVETELLKVLNGDASDFNNYPGYAAAGINILVDAPQVVSFNVAFEIRLLNTAQSDETQLISIAKDAALTYINTLNLGFDYIESELICSVKAAHPDIYDVIVTTPISNLVINANEVARVDSGNMTVTSQIVGP